MSKHRIARVQVAEYLLLALILLVAAGLRFYHLGAKGLWGDEIWTTTWSQVSLRDVFVTLTRPPDMPLIYALVHLSTRIATSEFWVRFPAGLFGVIGVFAQYLLMKQWFARRLALLGALLLAIAPFHIWYSQDARYYTVFTAFSLLSLYFFWRVLKANPLQPIAWVGYLVTTIALIYTHIFGYWVVLAEGLFGVFYVIRRFIVQRRNGQGAGSVMRRQLAPFALSQLLLIVAAFPTIVKIVRVLQSGSGPTGEALAAFTATPTIPYYFNLEFVGQLVRYMGGGRVAAVLFGLFFIIGLADTILRKRAIAVLTLLYLFLPFLSSFFLIFYHPISYKYFVYLQPILLGFVAVGMMDVSRRIIEGAEKNGRLSQIRGKIGPYQQWLPIFFAVGSILLLIEPIRLVYKQARINDWRSIATYLERNTTPGDVILTERWGRAALQYYLNVPGDLRLLVANENRISTLDVFDRNVWFVGINGPIDKVLRNQYTPVAESAWQDSRFSYHSQASDAIVYPITEDPAAIYLLKERAPGSTIHFVDIDAAAWTDRSYREIPLGEIRRVTLVPSGVPPYTLTISFFDQKDRGFAILVNDVLVGSVETGKTKGWQVWQMDVTHLITKSAANMIALKPTGPTLSAVVESIKLRGLLSEQAALKAPDLVAPSSIWVIGDSLTRGLFASREATTYRNILFSQLQDQFPGQVRQTFWSGVCTLAGMEQEWDAWSGKPQLVFIELGINDLGGNRDCPQIEEQDWRDYYGMMLDRIIAASPDVQIVVGTIPWSGWDLESEGWQKALRYNDWIRSEAEKRDIAVADLWAATVNKRDGLSTPEQASVFPPYYHGDGFHPNDTGHQRLANTFMTAYLERYVSVQDAPKQ